MVTESAWKKLKEYMCKNMDVRMRIFLGAFFPLYLFAVTSIFFADMTCFDYTGDHEVFWCVQFSSLSCVFFLLLYGRALCHKTSIMWGGLISLCCFAAVGFVVMYFQVTQLMTGVLAITMGVSVMVYANSWLFRFRGGRIVGLLIVFALASVLYSKLKLTFNNYPYASEPVVEPFHIANQLVGVALPVRGQFNGGSVSTIKPLLYEGCHFFIWLFLISLAVSFTNRELINRLYLKLTQFKPLYVFWSNNGSSEEEAVAEDIVRGKFFRPNVVLALWGKDKENAADVCDKWKHGRRWIEASSAEYDDIASHANVHYILSSDGNANLVKCMELMRHVANGTIYVRTDGADDCCLNVFDDYVRRFLKCNNPTPIIRTFSEIQLIKDEMQKKGIPNYEEKNNVFLVNYFKGNGFGGSASKELLATEVGTVNKLAKSLNVPDWQVVGCDDKQLERAEAIIFCGVEPRFQIKAIDKYYYAHRKPGNSNVMVYAYARERYLVDLLQKCYGGLTIFGSEQSLFTQSRIKQVTDDRKAKGDRT